MTKISEFESGQVVKVVSGLMWCYDNPDRDGAAFTIKADTYLIYDCFIVNDYGVFLKFVHIEDCKVFYDYWKSSKDTSSLDKYCNAFEKI